MRSAFHTATFAEATQRFRQVCFMVKLMVESKRKARPKRRTFRQVYTTPG